MSVQLGSGDFTFAVAEDWAKLPAGWELGDVGGVGVDRFDRVYVFNRSAHPMVIFDRDGKFLTSWGEGVFPHVHGLSMGPDDTVYCTDDGDHTMRKCTLEGEILMEIGSAGVPSPFMSGEPFRRCTHSALAPNGDIYISDGYANARIHKYSPDGVLLKSWGEPGVGEGQFNLPHNIACDPDGWVYVADRENHRVQVFDGDGNFEMLWHNVHRPCGLCITPGRDPICFVGECGPDYGFSRGAPNLGPRISVLTHDGRLLERLESTPAAGTEPGQFICPHGLAFDSHGDLYVGEVSVTAWKLLFPDQPVPKGVRSLQKLVKVNA